MDMYGQNPTQLALTAESYPERPGEPNCLYYMRTGTCGYATSCRFNHPRTAGAGAVRLGGDYPEREGQPLCQYFALSHFAVLHSPSVASPQQYGVTSSWQAARPPLLPGSYVQGAYAPVLLSPGMAPLQAWNTYTAPLSPVASPATQLTAGAGPVYRVTQLSPSAAAYTGSYQSLPSSSALSSSSQMESMFPERPGQPECQYYMKTGDCKFGSTCRYHHPPERISPKATAALSIMGLPLRPGALTCSFYSQHGVCKFGPMCRFDHPVGTLSYSPSASSLVDMPVAPYPIGSSLATLAPSSSTSELRLEVSKGSSQSSFSTRMASADNTPSSLIGPVFSRRGSGPHPNVQLSVQSSSPSGGSGGGHGDDVGS